MEELGRAHQAQLVALLDDSDSDVLRGAARLTGQLGIVSAAPKLTALLQRPDPTVRRAAVEALAQTRTSMAMEALQRSLADDDRDVRVAAARGLTALRYAPARDKLAALLDSKQVRDADLTEKLAFFEAYGAIAGADGVALLDRILNGRRLLAKESPEMRACAAQGLGRISSPTARESLQRSANETNPIVRTAVSKALRPEGGR
jgi:HEAT repeat protein